MATSAVEKTGKRYWAPRRLLFGFASHSTSGDGDSTMSFRCSRWYESDLRLRETRRGGGGSRSRIESHALLPLQLYPLAKTDRLFSAVLFAAASLALRSLSRSISITGLVSSACRTARTFQSYEKRAKGGRIRGETIERGYNARPFFSLSTATARCFPLSLTLSFLPFFRSTPNHNDLSADRPRPARG